MNNIKQDSNPNKLRLYSFLIIGVIYLWVAIIGVLLAYFLPFNAWLDILIADIVCTVFIFIFSVIFKNASIYDPYWSVQPMVIGLALLLYSKQFTIYNILLLITVFIWGIRLTLNWVYTFKGLDFQDWRYTQLKQQTKNFYPLINFIGIHMIPTLIVYCVCLPMIFAFLNPTATNAGNIIFLIIALLAVILQCVADTTMHKFRKAKILGKRNDTFIRDGVWKYSRHPNYLAEILFWWSIAISFIFTISSLWYLAVGALANTLLFLFVSIPLADGKQKKKDGFNQYKKETFMLLPLPFKYLKNKQ